MFEPRPNATSFKLPSQYKSYPPPSTPAKKMGKKSVGYDLYPSACVVETKPPGPVKNIALAYGVINETDPISTYYSTQYP